MSVDNHSAYISLRGGLDLQFPLLDFSYVQWGRERDAISGATIRIPISTALAQQADLDSIDPGLHELIIFRGENRVWEGPVNLPQYTAKEVEITALDTCQYWNRTAMRAGYDSSYPRTEKVVSRIARIMMAEGSRKEALGYNLLSHIHTYVDDDDASTTTKTEPMEMVVFAHLDSLAARSGIDYTVVGRELHLWDTSKSKMGQTSALTDSDFVSPVTISLYGAELATRSYVTDGQGNWQVSGPEVDPKYGEWEQIQNAYDEEEGGPLPTAAELLSQAKRNQSGRNPTPVHIRVPENSTVNPGGLLTIDDLVPGKYMPLSSTLGVKKVSQMQKLQSATVTETEKGETIQISLYPTTDAGAL
jgi:hypothetical protein